MARHLWSHRLHPPPFPAHLWRLCQVPVSCTQKALLLQRAQTPPGGGCADLRHWLPGPHTRPLQLLVCGPDWPPHRLPSDAQRGLCGLLHWPASDAWPDGQAVGVVSTNSKIFF